MLKNTNKKLSDKDNELKEVLNLAEELGNESERLK